MAGSYTRERMVRSTHRRGAAPEGKNSHQNTSFTPHFTYKKWVIRCTRVRTKNTPRYVCRATRKVSASRLPDDLRCSRTKTIDNMAITGVRPEHGDFIFNSMTKRKCVALLPTVWKEPWCGWEQLGMENESYRWSIGRNFFPRCAPRHPPWPLNYRLTF